LKLNPRTWFKDVDTYSLGDDAVLQAFFGSLSSLSASGMRVNRETVLRSTCALACLIVRAETHSALPVDVLRKDGRYRRDISGGSAAYRVLGVEANPLMTAGEFWRWEDMREDIYGNAYARIVWRGLEPVEIWPLTGADPVLVWDKALGTGAYQYTGDTYTPGDIYPLRDILHFKGAVIGTNLQGRSLVDLASEAIGVSIASEQFFARLLGNGNHFPGWLETEQSLPEPAYKVIADRLKGTAGVVQAGVLRIFDRGLKYKANPMTIKDSDLTAQMRWQLQQVCSVFRVPMAMVQDLTNGTYTNSEQQDLWLGKHTILPMCVNKERVANARLFRNPADYMKFNLSGLLRGDYKTRMEGHSQAINAGFMTRNEARELEDMNPENGLDMPVLNLGYGTVDARGAVHGAEKAPVAKVLEPITRDAIDCIRRRAEADTKKGKAKDATVDFAAEKLAPVIEAHRIAGIEFDPETFIAEAIGTDREVTR
jgi:HK97 family phage portal protein